MNIELPKDAEGREIPLDTTVLYDKDGNEIEVSRYQCYPKVGPGYWNLRSVKNKYYRTDEVYLIPPDSWEKLEEDLDRALSTPNPDTYASITCGYFDSGNVNCAVCERKHGIRSERCTDDAWMDIASRIRKLRGEGE